MQGKGRKGVPHCRVFFWGGFFCFLGGKSIDGGRREGRKQAKTYASSCCDSSVPGSGHEDQHLNGWNTRLISEQRGGALLAEYSNRLMSVYFSEGKNDASGLGMPGKAKKDEKAERGKKGRKRKLIDLDPGQTEHVGGGIDMQKKKKKGHLGKIRKYARFPYYNSKLM